MDCLQANKLHGEIKLELINYYDYLKSDIDIVAQNKLLQIEKGEVNPRNKQKILDLYKHLIDKSNEIFESSCKSLDDYFARIKNHNGILDEKTQIKRREIKNFCYFIENSVLNTDFKNENQLGLFISFDWFLDENQVNYIRIKTENLKSSIQFNLNQDVIVLKHGFELMDEHELPSCNSLFKNVVYFSENFLLLHLSKLTRTRLDLKYKSEDEKYSYIKNVEKDSFKCLTSLKSLELICDKNLIENGLNKHFSTNNLEELNISCDALGQIDYNMFKEVQNTLTKLSLFNCQITQIHNDAFKDMKKLIKLDLSWNHFDINNSNNLFMNDLVNLESLDMIRCGLHTIENNLFFNLVNLKELNLKINQFDTIKHTWFRGLHNLKILNLSNCEISIVENDSFKDLYNLEELDLSENKIDIIQTKSLQNLPNLKILDLKRCQIKSIEDNSFNKMLNLEELYLTKNKIHLLKAEQFNGLTNLKVLDLRGNNLTEISNKPFVNLNKLEDLFLHDFDFTSKTQKNHEFMKIKTKNDLIINEFDF